MEPGSSGHLAQWDLAIIGGGFAATVALVSLASRSRAGLRPGLGRDLKIVVVAGTHRLGPGMAYAARSDLFLLNVRASRMSVDPDRPGDFQDWAGCDDPDAFLPRRLYGAYLASRFEQALDQVRAAGMDVRVLPDRATGLQVTDTLCTIALAGETITAASVLLCTGPDLKQAAPACAGRWVAQPWPVALEDDAALAGEGIVIGTGLTAADACLALLERPQVSRVTALSADGEWPQPHAPCTGPVVPPPLALRSPSALVRHLRNAPDWRAAIDGVRSVANTTWQGWHPDARRRAGRLLAGVWNRHRHRLAPEVLARLGAAEADGRLVRRKLLVTGVEAGPDGLRIATSAGCLSADFGVDARGFRLEDGRGEGLAAGLVTAGAARLSALGIGLEGDPSGLVTRPGLAPVRAIGACRLGDLLETTGVPEVRAQTVAALDAALDALSGAGPKTGGCHPARLMGAG